MIVLSTSTSKIIIFGSPLRSASYSLASPRHTTFLHFLTRSIKGRANKMYSVRTSLCPPSHSFNIMTTDVFMIQKLVVPSFDSSRVCSFLLFFSWWMIMFSVDVLGVDIIIISRIRIFILLQAPFLLPSRIQYSNIV